jgi:methionine sulfoxide reductase heme-binding subunit
VAGGAMIVRPMLAASAANPSPLWFATRGAGVMTLVCLTVVVILGISTSLRVAGRNSPRFVVASLHRNFGLFTIVLLAVHIATSVLDPFAGIRALDAVVPFAGAYRTFWLGLGVVAAEVLLAITVTSLLRGRLGPRMWRIIHWAAYASWPLAVVHGLGTGSDAQAPWLLGLTAACMAAVLYTLTRRLLVGRLQTLPIRLGGAGVAVFVTYAICAWSLGGPLRPGWAITAGTPASILAAKPSSPPLRSSEHGFADSFIGTMTRTSKGVNIALRDTVDTALTIVIVPPGPTMTLPQLTVARNGVSVCANVPARVGVSVYAVCNQTRLVITMFGAGPSITGRIVTSGPL